MVTITVSKLCSSSIGRANQSGRDGTSISATAAVTAAGAGVGNGGLVLDVAAPLSESFRNTFPKVHMYEWNHVDFRVKCQEPLVRVAI